MCTHPSKDQHQGAVYTQTRKEYFLNPDSDFSRSFALLGQQVTGLWRERLASFHSSPTPSSLAWSGSQEQRRCLMRVPQLFLASSRKGSGQSLHSPLTPTKGAALRTQVLGNLTRGLRGHQVKPRAAQHTDEQAAALPRAGLDPQTPQHKPQLFNTHKHG